MAGDIAHAQDPEQRSDPSRRRFLGLVAGGIAAAVGGGWAGARLFIRGTGAAYRTRTGPSQSASVSAPRVSGPSPPMVVRVSHPGAIRARGPVDRARSSHLPPEGALAHDAARADSAVAGMVDAAVTRLTGRRDPAAAWGSLFSPNDVVAIKVNCLAAPHLSTHPAIVNAIVAGLRSAGVRDDNIIIYDRLSRELERAGFAVNTGRGVRCFGSDVSGYDADPTEAGSVGSCLSRIVSDLCTAIINVPLVKDHDVAGVSVALKNHFGSIHNPNKQHEHRCCPQVADVNLLPALRRKQRLIIADALAVTYDGGPAYKPATTAAYNSILAARDPVALDAVALDIIEKLRRRAGLPTLAKEGRHPDYIAVAADANHRLGVADLAHIQRVEVNLAHGART